MKVFDGSDYEEQAAKPDAQPQRHRPCFQGQRFVVHDWQLENLRRLLGPFADDFDLFSWFETFDQYLFDKAIVIPQRDGGVWLMARALDEAVRRGLPVVTGESLRQQQAKLRIKEQQEVRASWSVTDCKHDPKHGGRHACMVQTALEAARESRQPVEEG